MSKGNDSHENGLRLFRLYSEELSDIAARALKGTLCDDGTLAGHLSGEPKRIIQATVSADYRRAHGLFLTGRELAEFAIRPLSLVGPVWDPACGAGDLLLAVARKLPVSGYLDDTVKVWGEELLGSDLHPELVNAARARLILLAWERGARSLRQPMAFSRAFPRLQKADGLTAKLPTERLRHIVLNPPFAQTSQHRSAWGRGRTTAAALFLDRCAAVAPEATTITAILPDSLRSGSRYHKWRRHVSVAAALTSIRVWGRFDDADVDVFVADLTKNLPGTANGHWVPYSDGSTVADYFDVHVGPVVPYRNQTLGPWRDFLDCTALRANAPRRIRWRGRVYDGPFVLIRRTSSPKDVPRARANVLSVATNVALENHLLIALPKSGSVEECGRLADYLRTHFVTELLNARNRCRHLTVHAIGGLPWHE